MYIDRHPYWYPIIRAEIYPWRDEATPLAAHIMVTDRAEVIFDGKADRYWDREEADQLHAAFQEAFKIADGVKAEREQGTASQEESQSPAPVNG